MDNNGKEIYLFGIRPTNQLQLGNFLLIKQFLHLQEKKCVEIRIMIADLHYVESQEKVINLTKMLAACGLKITQVKFFVQSMLPYHTQLAFLLLNFVTIGELERMIQFKQKKQTKLKDENNTFLLFYPVLMAADIIIQRANYVLIGEDQKQHFELTKKIIKRINYHLSQKISFPKIFFVKHPKIKDLKNPEKKMSKSSPEGAIFLNEDLNSI